MSKKIANSAERVQNFLRERGYDLKVVEFPESTRTAKEAALAIGCEVSQIAKSLIFIDKNTGHPVLVIAAGSNLVDVKKVEGFTGLQLVKADGKFVKEKLGFVIGGVPPVAHNQKVITFLDQTLLEHEWIWAAAGTPFAVFQLNSKELQKLTEGQFIDLKVD